MLSLIASLFVIFVFPIYGEQLHDYMTKEEKESLFRVKHDEVHTVKYELIPIVTKCARSQDSIDTEHNSSTSEFEKYSLYMETYGENFELYLEENNNILFGSRTPIIKPYMGSDGSLKYDKRDYNIIPALNMVAYHDRKKRAALTIYKDENGRINVNGLINDTIIIRSIPKRLHEEVLNKNINLSRPLRAFNKKYVAHHHIVIKREIQSNLDYVSVGTIFPRSEKEEPFDSKSTFTPSNYREFTAYPKLLIILDHATYLLNNKNVLECIRHTIAYWNVVDLRFREMEKPYIRLNIAGVIIATNPNATPYMETQKSSVSSRYDQEALKDLKDFFTLENVTYIDYDIVVGISPWRLVKGGNWWQSILNSFTKTNLDDSIHGIAYLGSICKFPRQAMALVRDGGDLFTAGVAAHEICHILGVEHDPENASEDDPDYKSHWKHGFLMSYARVNKNQMHWSDASINSMQENLQRHENNHCLRHKPRVGTPYRKILPGKFVNRNEQCKVLLGPMSYSHKNLRHINDCLSNYCFSPDKGTYLKINIPVAEGSHCGIRKICIEGECVHDPTDPVVYQDLLAKIGSKK